ncbi:lysoplasmalogenase family protein [Gramella jeungdoensis]
MLPRSFLSVVTLILLVANCFVIYEYDQDANRWARLISTFIFFLILLWQNFSGKRMIGAFAFLLISDLLLFHYENTTGNAFAFISRISAYVLFVMVIAPELKKLKTNLFQKFIFVMVLGLNLAMLVMLVDMVPERFKYPYLDVLFYIYGMSMIIMVIASISYSNRYSNNTSFFYTAATLCLVFSDITSFIAYYLEFSEFYFPDRVFYIIGIAGLVKFSSLSRSHEAVSELESL